MELLKDKRGDFVETKHLTMTQVQLTWRMPLSEMIADFYDNLKSVSRGYASLDYEIKGYESKSRLTKVEILVQQEPCDALSFVAVRDKAYDEARRLLERLRELIPRQLFEVSLQAQCDGKIIAKERVMSMRKDVLAKCYGGDISRKMKLLAKQKEGKKKMRMIGKVEVPPEAFLTVLKRGG
ncbi:MAG: elongation factor 4, partial [Elusimicrobiota bacterium]